MFIIYEFRFLNSIAQMNQNGKYNPKINKFMNRISSEKVYENKLLFFEEFLVKYQYIPIHLVISGTKQCLKLNKVEQSSSGSLIFSVFEFNE